WTGRGLNLAGLSFCGNFSTQIQQDPVGALNARVDDAVTKWHASFLRIVMDTTNFISNAGSFRDHLVQVVNHIGTYPAVKVLLSVYTDPTFDQSSGGTGCCASVNTDPLYRALVDTFKNHNYVMFGISNEPGASWTEAKLWDVMNHAVGTIRTEEDVIGSIHHL